MGTSQNYLKDEYVGICLSQEILVADACFLKHPEPTYYLFRKVGSLFSRIYLTSL